VQKLGLLGDLHFTSKAPERRKDDYYQTLLGKLKQAFDIFEGENCQWVLQPGDFFDSPQVGNKVIADVIKLILRYHFEVLVCAGQHDIFGHSLETLHSSPLSVLEAANSISLLGRNKSLIGERAWVYGASFGEEVPTPFKVDGYLNVLVTHRMIGNRQLYPDQPLEDPREFLRKYPMYDLVLCGDYHYRFQDHYQGRVIINPGAIIRKTISKYDQEHTPAVCILDLKDLSVKVVELKVKPVEEVFDLAVKPNTDERNEALNRFISSLREQNQFKVGWKVILSKVLGERKPRQSVQDLLNRVLEDVKC
jgi:exonuclease SbcD